MLAVDRHRHEAGGELQVVQRDALAVRRGQPVVDRRVAEFERAGGSREDASRLLGYVVVGTIVLAMFLPLIALITKMTGGG